MAGAAEADQPHPPPQIRRKAYMPRNVTRANARKSAIRAAVEQDFGPQKNRFGVFIRTTGLAQAEAKRTLANLA